MTPIDKKKDNANASQTFKNLNNEEEKATTPHMKKTQLDVMMQNTSIGEGSAPA